MKTKKNRTMKLKIFAILLSAGCFIIGIYETIYKNDWVVTCLGILAGIVVLLQWFLGIIPKYEQLTELKRMQREICSRIMALKNS